MEQSLRELLDDLEQIVHTLKQSFVGKDELVELLATMAIAQEHLLIVGPPGTAKSELIKRFALFCRGSDSKQGGYFEYLLTRFTEPNEIFGAIDIKGFREGAGAKRTTKGMLPTAEIVFLDEVFKANSAILNALLTILNERTFYNNGQPEEVPLICVVGATNSVPDDMELHALYDRFLLRVWTDNVEESHFNALFQRGWQLEKNRIAAGYGMALDSLINPNELRTLHRALEQVDLSPIANDYREVVRRIRAEGVRLSDRRVIKLLKLIAASALRHKRIHNKQVVASPADFWVLYHVWNDPEQITNLQKIVAPYVEAHGGPQRQAERSLATIADELAFLAREQTRLRHETDYADFLQQVEQIRRALIGHSSVEAETDSPTYQENQALQARASQLIEAVLSILEKEL